MTDEKCDHKETVKQLPSIDGDVLVRCKKCSVVVRSYSLKQKRKRGH